MTDFSYTVMFNNSAYKWHDVINWLNDVVEDGGWTISLGGSYIELFDGSIMFKHSEDAIMFKLKFGSL